MSTLRKVVFLVERGVELGSVETLLRRNQRSLLFSLASKDTWAEQKAVLSRCFEEVFLPLSPEGVPRETLVAIVLPVMNLNNEEELRKLLSRVDAQVIRVYRRNVMEQAFDASSGDNKEFIEEQLKLIEKERKKVDELLFRFQGVRSAFAMEDFEDNPVAFIVDLLESLRLRDTDVVADGGLDVDKPLRTELRSFEHKFRGTKYQEMF